MASFALPGAARAGAWRRPEWPWIALVVAAWVALVAGAVAGVGERHAAMAAGSEGYGAFATGLGWWALMVVAMMVPATIPVLRRIGLESMWHRRYRAPLMFLGAYAAVWVAFGVVALAAFQLAAALGVAGHALHGAAATGALLLIAANWQLAPQHRRCLKRCQRALPLGARGRAADCACLRYGLFHARQCAGACWPLMLAMVPGHGIALMVALTALSSWQRLARRPNRMACAGALVALMGLVMLAG